MALPAGPAFTGAVQPVFDIIPVPRMRIDSQTRFGAVTCQTDIPFRVAGLASDQILSCLPGMAARPITGDKYRARMAALALTDIKLGMGRP